MYVSQILIEAYRSWKFQLSIASYGLNSSKIVSLYSMQYDNSQSRSIFSNSPMSIVIHQNNLWIETEYLQGYLVQRLVYWLPKRKVSCSNPGWIINEKSIEKIWNSHGTIGNIIREHDSMRVRRFIFFKLSFEQP